MKNKNQLTDDEKVALIKSHLFESLDVLKNLRVKRTIKFCLSCDKEINYKNAKIIGSDFFCKICFKKLSGQHIIGNSKDLLSPLEIERIKEASRLLSGIKDEEPKKVILKPINLLEGLTDTQIEIIKTMTKTHNLIPLGWSVDVKTGNMYYMGKFICSTQPIIESESFSQPIIENSLSKGKQK